MSIEQFLRHSVDVVENYTHLRIYHGVVSLKSLRKDFSHGQL
jgi:hypothetical protein